MKNKILLLLSMMVVFLLVVSCAPSQTGKAAEAELEQLSDAELEQVIAEGEAAGSAAVAGQATATSRVAAGKLPSAYKVAYKRLQKSLVVAPIALSGCGAAYDQYGKLVFLGATCGDLTKPYCNNNKCVDSEESKKACTPIPKAELCVWGQTCGNILDNCGATIQCGSLCGDLQKPYCDNNKCHG